jgi:hypothetical protein
MAGVFLSDVSRLAGVAPSYFHVMRAKFMAPDSPLANPDLANQAPRRPVIITRASAVQLLTSVRLTRAGMRTEGALLHGWRLAFEAPTGELRVGRGGALVPATDRPQGDPWPEGRTVLAFTGSAGRFVHVPTGARLQFDALAELGDVAAGLTIVDVGAVFAAVDALMTERAVG